MKKLPVLISIPHGGNRIPEEVQNLLSLSASDLFDDSDPFTRDIYDLTHVVSEVITTDIFRAVVDVNRSPDDLPPLNPDGVVKSKTCYGIQVYKDGKDLSNDLIHKLLHNYYYTYHDNIREAFYNHDIKFALDCHSMAAVAPAISPDKDAERPDICLSNADGESCDFEIIEKLADCMGKAFMTNNIEINKPFKGGFITRKYGRQPIPWIQVELNRKLYLSEPWFDSRSRKIDIIRLYQLKQLLIDALSRFIKTSIVILTLYVTYIDH